MTGIKYPFEVPYAEIEAACDAFVDLIFGDLESSFLFLPRGAGFVDYAQFQDAYEVIKRHTSGFALMQPVQVNNALRQDALAWVVLRTMLGFTASEWAYLATKESGISVPQGFARELDRGVRLNQRLFSSLSPQSQKRADALVITACRLLQEGAEQVSREVVHRLDKADTRSGLESVRHLSAEGVPYAMLLYERFLGRPFAGHRDAVAGLVGEVMENAVEEQLRRAGVSFRKTRRAERLAGFDQAPDLIVPDEWNPRVVIEAKLTEDDGTARDKVTRIQHLATISRQREERGSGGFQVVACIDGRGFGVRRADMRKLLEATQGKVFTAKTLDRLVESTDLARFRSVP